MPIIEETKHHLHYIEGHIELAILAQFKEAKAKNYDWDSDTEATMLFDFWLRESNKTGESNTENVTNRFHVTASSPVMMQSQSSKVMINQQSTPETPKATTSKDDSDHSNVDVFPSTSNIIQTTTSHDYSQHHDVDVHPSTSNVIIVPPKRNLASIFDDIVPYLMTYTPSVITSDRWVQYHELKKQVEVASTTLMTKIKNKMNYSSFLWKIKILVII
ncbi:hypothetical protein JTB14_024049 [Gonioctena quinquepunctata]|nr:hypothetical protein JTB14_024049 [Gonioctena quinquepunctata]